MPISTIGQNGLNAPLSLTSPTIATPTFTGQATIPTINLTGGQITFPATQSASSDANTLDDYEEGTFTPTSIGNSTAGVTTYAAQRGGYVKIGSLVMINLEIAYSALTGTGNLNINGIPFTSINDNNYQAIGSVMTQNLNWSGGTSIVSYMGGNGTTVNLYGISDDGLYTLQQCVNESANFLVSFTYRAAN
jgi:hypothetical protein